MKRLMVMLLLMIIFLAGCGERDVSQDPKAISIEDGGTFGYGDSKKTVEQVIEMEGKQDDTFSYWNYEDSTTIMYRKNENGEDKAVCFHLEDRKYITYQGIRVGDSWVEVKEKLGKTGEDNRLFILFNEGQRVSDDVMQDEWEDTWIIVSYAIDDEGKIKNILISDVKAIKYFG